MVNEEKKRLKNVRQRIIIRIFDAMTLKRIKHRLVLMSAMIVAIVILCVIVCYKEKNIRSKVYYVNNDNQVCVLQ